MNEENNAKIYANKVIEEYEKLKKVYETSSINSCTKTITGGKIKSIKRLLWGLYEIGLVSELDFMHEIPKYMKNNKYYIHNGKTYLCVLINAECKNQKKKAKEKPKCNECKCARRKIWEE